MGGCLCYSSFFDVSKLRVVVGDYNRSVSEGTESTWAVDKIIVHPQWKGNTFNNDIALIRLKGMLEYRHEVAPVCLPDAEISPSSVCMTTGWGFHIQVQVPVSILGGCSDDYVNTRVCACVRACVRAGVRARCWQHKSSPRQLQYFLQRLNLKHNICASCLKLNSIHVYQTPPLSFSCSPACPPARPPALAV